MIYGNQMLWKIYLMLLIVTLKLEMNADNGWSWKETAQNDQSVLLRRPDAIRDLYIETLPWCHFTSMDDLELWRTGQKAQPQLCKYEVKL